MGNGPTQVRGWGYTMESKDSNSNDNTYKRGDRGDNIKSTASELFQVRVCGR